MDEITKDIIVDCILLIGCLILLYRLIKDKPDSIEYARKNKKMLKQYKELEEAHYKKCMTSVKKMKSFNYVKESSTSLLE